jgi:hypothetical protein
MALFELKSSSYTEQLRVNLPSLFFYGCLITELALAIDLASSCYSTFDCSAFWPTLSYMGSFRDHDRLFMFALTWQAVLLGFFYLVAHTHYSPVLGTLNHRVMLVVGLVTAFALPWVGYIDEVTPHYLVPTEKIHLIIVVSFSTLTLLWVCLSFDCMRAAWRPQYRMLVKFQLLSVSLVAVSFYQWKNAYTDAAFTSEAYEALSEWAAVSVAVFAPYVYAKTFLDLRVSLSSKFNAA